MPDWFQWPSDLGQTEWADHPGRAYETTTHWLEVQPQQDASGNNTGRWTWVAYLIHKSGLRPTIGSGEAINRDVAMDLALQATQEPARYTFYYLRLRSDAEWDSDGEQAYFLASETFEDDAVVAGDPATVLSEFGVSGIAAAQRSTELHVGSSLAWEPAYPRRVDESGNCTIFIGCA